MFYAGETYWLNNTKLNAFFATKEKTKRQNLDFLVVPFRSWFIHVLAALYWKRKFLLHSLFV